MCTIPFITGTINSVEVADRSDQILFGYDNGMIACVKNK